MNESELKELKGLGVNRLYVKFFDVELRMGKARPRAKTVFVDSYPKGLEIVPVVFVRENALHKLDDEGVRVLASNIIKLSSEMLKAASIKEADGFQLDCDWTASSRENFFKLLSYTKEGLDRIGAGKISSTLRLHQLKYFERTGVPPADEALLMVYNINSPTSFEHQKTIFSSDEALDYLARLSEYPLPLSAAFPTFTWIRQFDEYRSFIRLINSADENALQRPEIKPVKDGQYEALEDCRVGNRRIHKGDILLTDKYSSTELIEVYEFIVNEIDIDRLILYDYSQESLRSLLNERKEFAEKLFE